MLHATETILDWTDSFVDIVAADAGDGRTLPTPIIRTQYPERAIRELLVNAVVHRTYFKVSTRSLKKSVLRIYKYST